MQDSVLSYILYGLITGFSEFVPVSTLAHQYLFSYFTGFAGDSALIRLLVHFGCLGALLLMCGKRWVHIYRERRIAKLPKNKRKRMPDTVAVLDSRLLLIGCIPITVGLCASHFVTPFFENLLILTAILVLSAISVYIPQYFAEGFHDSRNLSPRDGAVFGLMAALSVIPGLSQIGNMLYYGKIRGCSRSYLLELCYLFCGAMLLGWILADLITILVVGATVSWLIVLAGILAAGAAFGAGIGAIYLMRFLAVNLGFSAFSYYCWGLAVFSFVYYLIT